MFKRLQSLLTRELIEEFLRYVLVGGTAFLADFATFSLLLNRIFGDEGPWSRSLAATGGFCVGILVCYLLSLMFVFEKAKTENKGRSLKDFIVFTIVGIIGLGLTVVGMWITKNVIPLNPYLAKIGCAGVVLIWDYAARKILVFS